DNLAIEYGGGTAPVRAVDGISFSVAPGEILGLVGESGCGKSTVGFGLMRLLPEIARIRSGSVQFADQDLLRTTDSNMRALRGNRIAMIFQDPMTSLDPNFTIGDQITEPMREHLGLSASEARKRAIELLTQVGIPAATDRIDRYPHEFSGGMRQRVVIAIALSCDPQLLICDEPTSALDVTVQAQILALLRRLQTDRPDTGIIMITHDLGVVAQLCNRVAVMYAGQIIEQGTVREIFTDPQHPYTQGLLASLPGQVKKGQRLQAIEGVVPDMAHPPAGCRFQPRCPVALPICLEPPPLIQIGDRIVACVRAGAAEVAHAS
ncbi:MAG: ABC transporter ATP-binding protein, partial [Thermomicrobiales bacterium]